MAHAHTTHTSAGTMALFLPLSSLSSKELGKLDLGCLVLDLSCVILCFLSLSLPSTEQALTYQLLLHHTCLMVYKSSSGTPKATESLGKPSKSFCPCPAATSEARLVIGLGHGVLAPDCSILISLSTPAVFHITRQQPESVTTAVIHSTNSISVRYE